MKKLIFTLAISALALNLSAQDAAAPAAPASAWKKSAQFGINLAAAGFNDKWKEKQGGFNNTALGFLLNANADKTLSKGLWTNSLQMQYGNVRAQFGGTSSETRKSIDRLFLDSKYAGKINPKLNWFLGGNFMTQFAQGLDYGATARPKISNFLAPGVLSEGAGLEWKPVSFFNVQLGGATFRQTFVKDATVFANTKKADGSSYGVLAGKTSVNDMGVNLVANFDKNVAKNLNLKWRYSGFAVLASPMKSDVHRKLDHRLDLVTTAKLGKYVNANFTLIGLYDADIIDGLQRSTGLNVGLLYSM